MFTCDLTKGIDNTQQKLSKAHRNRKCKSHQEREGAKRDFIVLMGKTGFILADFGIEPAKRITTCRNRCDRLALNIRHDNVVSCEPVLNATDVLNLISVSHYVDLWKIGKLNYHPSDIDWREFGLAV